MINYDEHISKNANNLLSLPTKAALCAQIRKFSTFPRVIFCTMGKSAYACRKVVYTARSYGLNWHDLDVCHAFHGDAGLIKEGDLLIYVSKSGETRETIEVAKAFSEWESIAICSNPESSLVCYTRDKIIIPIEEEASPFGFAPMISTTMYLIVLHAILCEVVEATSCTLSQYARNHPSGKIGELLEDELLKK